VNLDDLFRDRGRLFWILNVSGWTGYALAAWLGALAHEKPEAYFAVILAAAVSGFIGTLPLRSLYRWLWSRSVIMLGSATLVACYVIAFFWQWLRNVLYYDWVKNSWQPEHLMDYVGGVLGSFYIMLCWSGLYFGIKYYQQLQEQTEQTLKAVAAAHQAQLKMLRYQLNPHFLFNTLNAISTLILDGAKQTANQAVSRLSDIDEQATNALVPSLILQPLIENAIKYAITPSEEGGTLRISARVQHGTLVLQLSDTGPGLGNGDNGQKSSGVGLRNTRERLQQLYGDAQAFTLAPNEPTGLTVTINIPFEEDRA